MGFLWVVAPMMAAGRGWRAFLTTAIVELGLLVLILLVDLTAMFDLGSDRQYSLLAVGLLTLFVLLPLMLGGLVLYAKHAERDMPGKICKICGYDLRASLERCPECGTPVKFDPDRF